MRSECSAKCAPLPLALLRAACMLLRLRPDARSCGARAASRRAVCPLCARRATRCDGASCACMRRQSWLRHDADTWRSTSQVSGARRCVHGSRSALLDKQSIVRSKAPAVVRTVSSVSSDELYSTAHALALFCSTVWEGPTCLSAAVSGCRASAWVGRIPARPCAVGGSDTAVATSGRHCRRGAARPSGSGSLAAAPPLPAALYALRGYGSGAGALVALRRRAPARRGSGCEHARAALAGSPALPASAGARGRARQARRCACAPVRARARTLAEQLQLRAGRAHATEAPGASWSVAGLRDRVRASSALRAWRGRQLSQDARRRRRRGGGSGHAAAAADACQARSRTESAAAAWLSAGGARPRRRPRRSRRRPPTAHGRAGILPTQADARQPLIAADKQVGPSQLFAVRNKTHAPDALRSVWLRSFSTAQFCWGRRSA